MRAEPSPHPEPEPRPEDADALGIFGAPPEIPAEPSPTVSATEPQLAHPALRAFAFLLDGLITLLVTVAVVFVGIFNETLDTLSGMVIIPALSAVVATLLTAVWGVTAGKALVGIRVVRDDTGGRPGLWAVSRSLVIVAPPLLTIAVAQVLGRIRVDGGYSSALDGVAIPMLFVPALLWTALLAVLALRPRYRGLQDLAGRSIVVHRRGSSR